MGYNKKGLGGGAENYMDELEKERAALRVTLASVEQNYQTVVKNCERRDKEIAALKARLAETQGALQWCSGSDDFSPGGKAHEGWLKVRHLVSFTPKPATDPA